MHPFERGQVETLCQWLDLYPEYLIAIFGPRQTGKTTIVRQTIQRIRLGSRYLAVDEPDGLALAPTHYSGAM